MFRIFYAKKDATLYEVSSEYNTGLDEILEIGKRLNNDGDTLLKSRSVIKFDMDEITSALTKYNTTIDACKFVLQLYTSHAKNLPSDYTIYTKLIAQDWINGTGQESNLTLDGVAWNTPMTGAAWISSSQNISINSSSFYASGSGAGGSWMALSGSGSSLGVINSESFSHRTTDLNIDVTNSIKVWISGSNGYTIPNYGFLLQFADEDELNTAVAGVVRFFSRETHTIYVPKITMYWDNSTFTTGSLTPANIESYVIYSHIKPAYKDTEISKIRIYARDKYPQKSPTNLFPMEQVKFLPTTTYYAVYDAATDEAIIPYDNIYNKVSCDTTSNFIYIDMNSFMPERYYRIELKLVDGFTEQIVDDKIYFKVVR